MPMLNSVNFLNTQRTILLQRHLAKLLKFLERMFAINYAYHSVGQSFRKGDSVRDDASGNHSAESLFGAMTQIHPLLQHSHSED